MIVEIPQINDVNIAPNPVGQNSKFVISVHITETTVDMSPEVWYSGEKITGEF